MLEHVSVCLSSSARNSYCYSGLYRNGRKGVCPDIFKKPFKELGIVVRIITDFFTQCKKKRDSSGRVKIFRD
jgi:hypothetical protein